MASRKGFLPAVRDEFKIHDLTFFNRTNLLEYKKKTGSLESSDAVAKRRFGTVQDSREICGGILDANFWS